MTSIDDNQRIVPLNNGILTDAGITLAENAMILDFGCGSGRHVYEYLDSGCANIFGYDVQQYLTLRNEADSFRFRLDLTDRLTRIPYPDNHFDFVYSYSVFEHVLDQEKAFHEIYRVMKPGAVSLHNFPSKWRPIEPHLFIPFGGAFRSYRYYRFWTALGIGAKFEGETDPRKLARTYTEFGQTGLCYPTGREIDAMLARCFDSVSYVTKAFLHWSPGRSRHLYPLIKMFPFLERLFRLLHTRVVLLGKRSGPSPDMAVGDSF